MKTSNLKLLWSVILLISSNMAFAQNNWTINGNGNTTGGVNFLGTINNESMSIRTNDIQDLTPYAVFQKHV